MRDGGYGVQGTVLAEPVTVVDEALAVPGAARREPSVVDAAGAPVVDAGGFRDGQFIACNFIDRRTTSAVERRAGAWLFGGFFRPHFGHFLFETISRLWAVEGLRGQIEGIVFFRQRVSMEMRPHLQRILDLLDIDLPIHFVDAPMAFERLYVPRQGSAVGPFSAGTPVFRNFVQSKLRLIAPREDAPKIWLTREGYRLRRGGIFDEVTLRQNLEAEGYVSFAPERASFEQQVATYLGATHIVGPDSSAMHLVGYVTRPETRVAILLRRPGGERDMVPQITGFSGRPPVVVDAITKLFQRDNERNLTWSVFAELDWARVWRDLREHGFIAGDEAWPAMRRVRRLRLLATYESRLKGKFKLIWLPGRPPPHGFGGGEAD